MTDDLIEQLAQTPRRLQAIVGSLAPEAWVAPGPAAPGETPWTLATLARHLRDIEVDGFQFRIEQILSQADPRWDRRLTGYLADETETDGPEALAAFAHARAATVARLRSLSPSQWAMTALHPRRGPLDLQFFAQAFLEHDHEHLRQAEAFVERWEEQGR